MSKDWVELFDGETLDGWSATGDPGAWLVDDGHLHCTGDSGGMLYSHDTYEDFDLHVEYRTEADVNSGVFFRWSDLDDPVHTGLEVQILDTHGTPDDELTDHDCGALYDLVEPATQAAKPAGEWNTLELTCVGPTIQETLNGERVLDVDIDRWVRPGENPDGTENKFDCAWATMPRRGHLGLQDHGGRIWFRNLRVRDR
jgi:hypothetical protein